jgi:DNA polymerase-1
VEGKLFPPVEDILRELFLETDVTDAELWNEHTTDRTIPVLVLGNLPSKLPITYVKTLSQKQILSNPAALTELVAATTQLLTPFVFPEMHYVMDDINVLQCMGKIVVVDIETGGDIDIMLPEEMWLLSVAITDGKNIVVFSEEWLARITNRTTLIRFLKSGRKLIAHNMKFDFRSLSAQLKTDIKGHLCTLLLHHALNPGAKEHDLKNLATKYLGAPRWADAGKEYVKGFYKELPDFYPALLKQRYAGKRVSVGFEAIPKSILYKYNAYDVFYTWFLYEYLARGAAGDERIAKIAKFEFNMSNLFQEVEKNGVAVDLEYLDELHRNLTVQAAFNLSAIQELTGHEKFNPNSPKQVKEYYAEIGIKVKGTAVAVLEDLKLEEDSVGGQFTTLLLAARKISKLKGTYVEGIQKRLHNGLVYPDFLVHGTSTGRLSSRDPNIQNVPRDEEGKISLRKIFIPRDVATRSLLMVDYSQAELRVMACMSGDEYLISLFQPGMPDFFDSLMPIAYPRVDLTGVDKNTKKNMRANLKGVIYGISYGRGANAIAKALEMSPKDAQQIITNYFRAAPQLYTWRQWITETAISPEHTLISPFGRYYQAEVVTSRTKQSVINSGLAFLPQSTASDICVVAAMAVQTWIHEYDAVIIATIHDAIMIDCPDVHLQEVSDRVQAEMQASGKAVFGDVVPFATDATHNKSWEGI